MKAKEWAINIWKREEKNWVNRRQDLNYRECLVHPALEEQLKGIRAKKGVFVDLGCGDGTETQFLKRILEKKGFNHFYGFDIHNGFIGRAQKSRNKNKELVFDCGELSDLISKYDLHECADLATSMFVIQDEPNCKGLIEVMQSYLKRNGIFLAVTVHPQSTESLIEKRELKIVNDVQKSRKDDYIFAAEYPITEVGRPPFYVTYFHRALSDYIRMLEKHFHIEEIKGLKPSKQLLTAANKRKIAPFYKEKHNVYWPNIAESSSTVIIKGVKK